MKIVAQRLNPRLGVRVRAEDGRSDPSREIRDFSQRSFVGRQRLDPLGEHLRRAEVIAVPDSVANGLARHLYCPAAVCIAENMLYM